MQRRDRKVVGIQAGAAKLVPCEVHQGVDARPASDGPHSCPAPAVGARVAPRARDPGRKGGAQLGEYRADIPGLPRAGGKTSPRPLKDLRHRREPPGKPYFNALGGGRRCGRGPAGRRPRPCVQEPRARGAPVIHLYHTGAPVALDGPLL